MLFGIVFNYEPAMRSQYNLHIYSSLVYSSMDFVETKSVN